MLQDRTIHREYQLIEQALSGNAQAFADLYLRYLDPIYRYIFFRVGEASDAEDLTEQTFLKAWEALPGYRNYGNPFSSWLYRIAHNTVVDYHRRRKAAVPMSEVRPPEANDQAVGLLKQVIESEEVAALAEAVAKLPPDQQQVIILRFIEGLEHAEVARILEKSVGACRMLQYRALTTLYQLMISTQG